MCPPSSLPDPRNLTPQISQSSPDITIPDIVPHTPLCHTAYTIALTNLPSAILNHSLRVYIYAKNLATRESSSWSQPHKLPLLFTACIFHDAGIAPRFNGPQRFEVEGADAAAAHLREQGIEEEDVREVWAAIALHTSPGIAERISDLARLIRLGPLIDFGFVEKVGAVEFWEVRKESEGLWPRLGAEKVLGDTVVAQALERGEKAPGGSWPGDLVRAKREDPEWEGVNRAF